MLLLEQDNEKRKKEDWAVKEAEGAVKKARLSYIDYSLSPTVGFQKKRGNTPYIPSSSFIIKEFKGNFFFFFL